MEILSFYTCVPKMMIRWCMVPEIWSAINGRTNRWIDGRKKWHIEVGAPPKKINISSRAQLSLGWKKERIVKQILLSKLWYIGQIYTIPKFMKEENKNNNSPTLNSEVWTRYYRHRYWIKLSRISMNLRIIKPHQCSLERSHAVLIELKK